MEKIITINNPEDHPDHPSLYNVVNMLFPHKIAVSRIQIDSFVSRLELHFGLEACEHYIKATKSDGHLDLWTVYPERKWVWLNARIEDTSIGGAMGAMFYFRSDVDMIFVKLLL